MWSKRFKSVTALLLAGSIIAAMPAVSSGFALSANAAAAVSSSSQSEWYYNTVSSVTEGEYVFYNSSTKTLMTDTLNSGNNSFPSYKADSLVFPARDSAVPSADSILTLSPTANFNLLPLPLPFILTYTTTVLYRSL